MTKIAVSIMVQSLDQALAAAACAAERGAQLAEFRVDRFTDDAALLAKLIRSCQLPCVITCRPNWEGGQFEGDEESRVAMLEQAGLGPYPAAYIDVELAAYQRSPALRQRIGRVLDRSTQPLAAAPGLILSSHDFASRPVDLYQRIEAMAAIPACRVMKMAWRARSLRDNIEAFELMASGHKPTIALCMGDFGLPSRVLAKKFGAVLTFVTLDPATATADGQPTIDDLKNLYRWDALGPETRVFGVIGYPVAHSASPAVHNAGFDHVGYDGVYLPMPIPPSYEQFKATVATWLDMPSLHFQGASVTIPHKQNLLRFAQEQGGDIEPLAQTIGAANTLVRHDDGTVSAFNTDYAAALDAVCDGLDIPRQELRGMSVAVIGAGGVARAVVAGFAKYGATVVIYNRTTSKAQDLASQFDGHTGNVAAAPLEKLCDTCCQIYINCTSVGMHPHIDESPIPEAGHIKGWGPGTVVFDTIYHPKQTRLLRQAHAAGCLTIPGTEMFVRQAAWQFRLWTGHEGPLELFGKVLANWIAR